MSTKTKSRHGNRFSLVVLPVEWKVSLQYGTWTV